MTEKTNKKAAESPTNIREDTLQLVGETLKNKRLDCSISIQEASTILNIQVPYLQALESGDWRVIPGEVYALGFLRQYAKYLKCNLDDAIQKLKSNNYTLSKPVTFPDPPIAPNRKWMIISLIGFIGLFIIFNVWNQQHSSPLPSHMMQEHANTVVEQQPAASPPQSKEIIASTKIDPVVEKNIKPNLPLSQEKTEEKLQPSTPKKDESNLQSNTASAHQKKTSSHDYIFTARHNDVWLQIYQHGQQDKPLREALLKHGEHLNFTSDQTLSITCGKPKALEISMDGKIVVAVGSMAKKSHIVRHFILPRPSTHNIQ